MSLARLLTSLLLSSHIRARGLFWGVAEKAHFWGPNSICVCQSWVHFWLSFGVNALLSKRKKLAPLVHYLFPEFFKISWNPTLLSNSFCTTACATVSDQEQTKICWVVIFNQTLLHSFLHLWLLWIHTSERTHMRGGWLSFVMCLILQLLKIIWVKM